MSVSCCLRRGNGAEMPVGARPIGYEDTSKTKITANKYGGGGGSRTRVRNRSQPGEFMLCPIPFGFASVTQNGQDAPEASPIDLTLAARTEPLKPASCMTSAHSPKAKPWKTAAYLIKQQVPVLGWQLCFCKRLRVPAPRHVSYAAIDPVETVTPPSLDRREKLPAVERRTRAVRNGSCCIFHSTSDSAFLPG